MLNLDYSFLNWAVIQSFVAKGFWFSIQLTFVAMSRSVMGERGRNEIYWRLWSG